MGIQKMWGKESKSGKKNNTKKNRQYLNDPLL